MTGADPFTLASDVSQFIAASPDLDEMLSAIARRVAEALDVWECNIYEYRPETDSLVATALWASEITEDDHAWLGASTRWPTGRATSTCSPSAACGSARPTILAVPAADRAIMERWGERSVLSVPLVFKDEVIGAMTLVEKRAPRRFTPDDLRLLELMAVPAAWPCTPRACPGGRRSRPAVSAPCSAPAGR